MADKDIVEVIFGRHSKYEVVRKKGGVLGGTEYFIYKDGKYHRGAFDSLAAAVEAASKEAKAQ